MLSLTEGTGVGSRGPCAPWSTLALLGKLCSDIVTKDLVNVRVNQKMKINCFAAPEVEVLVCKAIN
jgi:hypothetical protein